MDLRITLLIIIVGLMLTLGIIIIRRIKIKELEKEERKSISKYSYLDYYI